ncbi:MAG: hypothetical protein IPM52_09105 [Bacteroidetes bacterium]|nr:hypothetical protein [Bacteroidota bacterium]
MANKLFKTLIIAILVINSTGAFYGGLSLIADPTGQRLQMPLSYLEKSPFTDYFWPGVVLFAVNGLFGLLTLAAVLFRHPIARGLVAAQGILPGGWITMQMMLLQIFYPPLHLPFLLMGATLLGLALFKPKATA